MNTYGWIAHYSGTEAISLDGYRSRLTLQEVHLQFILEPDHIINGSGQRNLKALFRWYLALLRLYSPDAVRSNLYKNI